MGHALAVYRYTVKVWLTPPTGVASLRSDTLDISLPRRLYLHRSTDRSALQTANSPWSTGLKAIDRDLWDLCFPTSLRREDTIRLFGVMVLVLVLVVVLVVLVLVALVLVLLVGCCWWCCWCCWWFVSGGLLVVVSVVLVFVVCW